MKAMKAVSILSVLLMSVSCGTSTQDQSLYSTSGDAEDSQAEQSPFPVVDVAFEDLKAALIQAGDFSDVAIQEGYTRHFVRYELSASYAFWRGSAQVRHNGKLLALKGQTVSDSVPILGSLLASYDSAFRRIEVKGGDVDGISIEFAITKHLRRNEYASHGHLITFSKESNGKTRVAIDPRSYHNAVYRSGADHVKPTSVQKLQVNDKEIALDFANSRRLVIHLNNTLDIEFLAVDNRDNSSELIADFKGGTQLKRHQQ